MYDAGKVFVVLENNPRIETRSVGVADDETVAQEIVHTLQLYGSPDSSYTIEKETLWKK